MFIGFASTGIRQTVGFNLFELLLIYWRKGCLRFPTAHASALYLGTDIFWTVDESSPLHRFRIQVLDTV